MPEQHSSVVGGSTAKRIMNCPGSRRECAKAPPGKSSSYADEGTLLHEAMALILDEAVVNPRDVIGTVYKKHTLTEELYQDKILPALDKFDELLDEYHDAEFLAEASCHLRSIKGAFGTADVIGRTKTRSFVYDWKFGDGVIVSAEENEQGMFYGAAAMETPELADLFESDDDWPVDIGIIQPARGATEILSRWSTTVGRLRKFTLSLSVAVRESMRDDAPLARGDWCRFCPAIAMCPEYTGLAESSLRQSLDSITPDVIGHWLGVANAVEQWAAKVKQLGHDMGERGLDIPGWKLVQKRASRTWRDATVARSTLIDMVSDASTVFKTELVSPAQAEKALKADGLDPKNIAELVVLVSSGTTLVQESDKRPAITTTPATIRRISEKLKR